LPTVRVASATVAPPPGSNTCSEPTGAQQHRDAQLLAEQREAAIDVRHIAQYPRAEADRIERQAVACQGRIGLGAADQVVPIVAIEFGARLRHEFMQVLKTALERLGHDFILPRWFDDDRKVSLR